jgi:hypothetical protein
MMQQGISDTLVFAYNADSTVRSIIQTNAQWHGLTSFLYGGNYVRKVVTSSLSGEVVVDSIILNANGSPVVEYQHSSLYSDFTSIEFFSYDATGHLSSSLLTYPQSHSTNDTFSYKWENGDLQESTSNNAYGHHYGYHHHYDVSKPCAPGDALYLNHLMGTGSIACPNEHLNIWTSDENIAGRIDYVFDSNGRITKCTNYQDLFGTELSF